MSLGLHWCAAKLQLCKGSSWIIQGQQLHQVLLKSGHAASVFAANCLLRMYARCGQSLLYARCLFDEMPHPNCFSWNCLMDACLNSGDIASSLELFYGMPRKNEYSWNAIITGLVRSGNIRNAWKLFDEMPTKDSIALNSVLHGLVRSGRAHTALSLYKRLNSVAVGHSMLCLDSFVLATITNACAECKSLHSGRQVHSKMILTQVQLDPVLGSALVDMYAKCQDLNNAQSILLSSTVEPNDFSLSALITGFANSGRTDEARRIFDSERDPGIVLWNSMITGYCGSYANVEEALDLFKKMMSKGVDPDSSTLATVLSACAFLGSLRNVVQIHASVVKHGMSDDIVVGSTLLDSYSKAGAWEQACLVFGEFKVHDTVSLNSMIKVYSCCGQIAEAKQVFDRIQGKSVISWNSMIVGYSQNGLPAEALGLFSKMHILDVEMDEVTLASVISASASLALLGIGEQAFARATVCGLESGHIIATSLIDLYCKCGYMAEGWKIFEDMRTVDEAPWNSMLMGYASIGMGDEAIRLFEAMLRAGTVPNEVTFIAILSACSNCGLVEEGLRWFHCMKSEYGVNPCMEHYSCLVNMLVRAGRLKEALNFMDAMPFEADASIWTLLLGGCKASGNELLGDRVAKRLFELSPTQSGPYVQISSLYATNGDWNRSKSVWSMMHERRIKKNTAFSWIYR